MSRLCEAASNVYQSAQCDGLAIAASASRLVDRLWVSSRVLLAEQFDWRDVDGADYTTPVKHQGSTGTCWAFSVVAALEAKFEITHDQPSLDLDLSEQHLISSRCCGGLASGVPISALEYVVTHGITTESELPFAPMGSPPNWPLTGEYPLFGVSQYQSLDLRDQSGATATLKSALKQEGPVIAIVTVPEDWLAVPLFS